ncbi:hypothetical protein OHB06_19880 [Streptomyces sp. NBC_01604]|uniref:hypothetical protein n=1 Tax=Streptomyces sp. NBC_01604 TaxID=2975894 RepID=UPI003866C937
MRTRRAMAGIAGAGVLALVVTACGADGTDSGGSGDGEGADSAKGTSKPVALTVESTVREGTWTSSSAAQQVKIAPKRLTRGTAADLEDVNMDKDLQGMVPYYLTVGYTNTGSDAVTGRGPEANFTVTLADGTPGTPVTLWNSNSLATASSTNLPDDCHKAGPASVPPGGTATVCQLVMMPKGPEPATVAYSDETGGTLLWKVGDGKGDDDGLLAAGTTADSSWEDVTTKGAAVPIRVTPKSVRAGSLADLRDYDLTDTSKNTVPWYVSVEYRNVGKEKLLPVMDDGVALRSAGGRDVRPLLDLSISASKEGEGIDQCRGSVSNTRLQPNDTLTLCTIYLLPKGDRPAMVSFEGEGTGVKPLRWRAS